MKEIVEELLLTVKWLPENERQSVWYREYLEKVHLKLKSLTSA